MTISAIYTRWLDIGETMEFHLYVTDLLGMNLRRYPGYFSIPIDYRMDYEVDYFRIDNDKVVIGISLPV